MAAFNELFRYGSARYAEPHELRPFYRDGSLYLGVDERGRALWHPSDGPCLMTAGSGAGKAVSGGIMYNACAYPGSMLIVDLKGEIAYVSRIATAFLGKFALYINPARLHGLPNHPVDPLGILRGDCATLVPDAKAIAEMLQALSGSATALYFEKKVRGLLEAVMIFDAERNGIASLRTLYRVVNGIEAGSEQWVSFAEGMLASRYEHVRRVAAELAFKLRDAPKEFSGIAGEATNALAFLDDPAMLAGLEKPAFSLSILCERRCNIHVCVPAEYAGIWAPFIRLVCGVAMMHKFRRPDVPRFAVIADEAGQLKNAEFLMRAMTYGRSHVAIQACYQSTGQLADCFGREGAKTMIASAQVRQWFGVRDLETAETVSSMLGTQTLEYNAELDQAAARRNKAHIVRELMAGADPLEAGLNYAQQARAAVNLTKQARQLMTPAEVLNMPRDRQLIFASEINCPPLAAWRRPYWLHPELAGRFLPNPLHPSDRVQLPGRFGPRYARVITERVPERFAAFPQFQDGYWSYIEGYRPK